jgi:hypothetical protein
MDASSSIIPTPIIPTATEMAKDDSDRWYVTNGATAVGPVSFALMTRGVEAGRIPAGSFVRHETWKVWRKLEELGELTQKQREKTVEHLAQVSASAEERASNPHHDPPPPPPTHEELDVKVMDESRPPSLRPSEVDPVAVLHTALSLDSALALAISTSVAAAGAHIGFLHFVRMDLGATVTTYCHGPDSEVLLGERLAGNDAALVAAQAGHTVMGEPRLGEAGRYIAGRMARCLPGPRGVAMVPIVVNGLLCAMIEIGRATKPFRAHEIAKVEHVAETVANRITEMRWL